MLLYGDFANVVDKGVIFNITSLKEGFNRLPALIPPNEIGRFTGRDFDLAYANYIMSNDVVFKQFFDIISYLYTGTDVYMIVSNEDWSENLVESLLKLIQQRYGYNAMRINCFDDYLFAVNYATFDFNPYYGIKNLDIDRDRYTYIMESERLRSGGKLIYVE